MQAIQQPRRASFRDRHLHRPDLVTIVFGTALVATLAMVGLQVGAIAPPDPQMSANGTTITSAVRLEQGSYQLQWSTRSNQCVNPDGSSQRGSLQVQLVDGSRQTAVDGDQLTQHVILSTAQLTQGTGSSNFEVSAGGYYKLAVFSCGPWHITVHRL